MATVENELATPFIIRELTGDQRTITLKGRSLPYRPFELTGTQRYSLDWYPGSPVGTMQVFGAKEETTTITGYWKDKFLGGDLDFGSAPASVSSAGLEFVPEANEEVIVVNDERIRTVRELALIVDDFRRKGQEVEVTWLNIARRGIMERFTQKWHNGHDLEWEISFAWLSQAEDLSEIPLEAMSIDTADVPSQIQALVDNVGAIDEADLVPQAGVEFARIAQEIDHLTEELTDLTDELRDAVVQGIRLVTSPFEASQRLAGALDGIKLAARDVRDQLQNAADAAVLNGGETLSVISGGLSVLGVHLGRRRQLREQGRSATQLEGVAAGREAQIVKSMNPELARAFTATGGTDLRDVALRFYGTTDEWRSLLLFNRLESSSLRAGQIVFVPVTPPRGGC